MFVGYSVATLTLPHEPALTLLFTELDMTAAGQEKASLGSPGTLSQRTNDAGIRFWVHRFSDAAGRRREVYLGKTDDADVGRTVSALRDRIAAANITISRVRVLSRAGFATLDRKSYATLANLANHGLFRAGALLIGSHAYGALLNVIGVRAVPYATEDIDIARREALALPGVPAFLEMLCETGIEFFPVPQLKRGAPATSFRERGGSRMHVDLLVPSSSEDYPIIPVPELQAHATGLPHLAYLLGLSQEVPLLSPHGVVRVRVPVPERYAVHKLIVSQIRSSVSGKVHKDLRQAATLIEALSERFPGAVEEALSATPKSAASHLRRALVGLRAHLPQSAETAWDSLARLSERQSH